MSSGVRLLPGRFMTLRSRRDRSLGAFLLLAYLCLTILPGFPLLHHHKAVIDGNCCSGSCASGAAITSHQSDGESEFCPICAIQGLTKVDRCVSPAVYRHYAFDNSEVFLPGTRVLAHPYRSPAIPRAPPAL